MIPLDCEVCRRNNGFHRPHTSLRRCRSKVKQCTRNSIHVNTLRSMTEHKQVLRECQAVSNDASSTVSEQPDRLCRRASSVCDCQQGLLRLRRWIVTLIESQARWQQSLAHDRRHVPSVPGAGSAACTLHVCSACSATDQSTAIQTKH